MALAMPLRSLDSEYFTLLIVLERVNVERLKEYDPLEFEAVKLGPPWNGLRMANVIVTYAASEDMPKIVELHRADKPHEIIRLLSRGWKVHSTDFAGNYRDLQK